ncbi:hypothetical protein ACIA8J_31490 [Streptomyces asoensis]|uniref:hypothetical protein n=1 Tax=Streptomyces asoensis TaxID=249586 RepID=UPI0037B3961A
MSRRGRKAALPPGEPPRRPPTQVPGTLLVEHRDKKGRIARYDFARCQGPALLKASLARLFAGCCTRGIWDSLDTSSKAFWVVRTFSAFVSEHHPEVEDVDGVTTVVWKEWKLSRAASSGGNTQVKLIARLLREDSRLSEAAREAMMERSAPVKASEQSYAPNEFTQVATVARRIFRAAHLRITDNAARLAAWRAGEYTEGSDEWLVGEALDCMARTGDTPHYIGQGDRRRPIHRYIRPLGGANALCTWRRLFPTLSEITALATLLTVEHGLNLSTAVHLAVPRAAPDPGEDGFPIYRLELEKQRRGRRRQFETRNLADFGAASPGRLITQALEVTAFARAVVHEQVPDLDRLLIWRDSSGRGYDEDVIRVGPFGVGTTTAYASVWAKAEGLSGSPFRRTRRTVNVLHRREPGQNTQDTHDSVYVLPDRQAQQAAAGTIADGATSALHKARETVLVAALRSSPDPHDETTVTADCHDSKHSPFTSHGVSCSASFLLCLACPNARIHPGHHPRLAHLHQALENLRSVMDPAEWHADWHDAHARLSHLKRLLGPPAWDKALRDVTGADRDMIDHLLKGDFAK